MNKTTFSDGTTPGITADFLNGVQDQVISNQNLLTTLKNTVDGLKLEILKAENPVGTIRMQTVSTNPATLLGFGTWVLWGSGKVPVGINTSDSDFNTVEKTGGAKKHKHWAGGYKANMEIGTSNGSIYIDAQYGKSNPSVSFPENTRFWFNNGSKETSHSETNDYGVSVSGQSEEVSNVMPYITCYMWKRTA